MKLFTNIRTPTISPVTRTVGFINSTCYRESSFIFEFAFPGLAPGEYMLTPAVAKGTLQVHRQLYWIYDAMPVQFESKENGGTIIAAKCRACMFFG